MFEPSENGYRYAEADGIWLPDTDRPHFDYSDGAAFEIDLLQTVRSAPDVSVFSPDLISKIVDWPSLYHLTSRRSNLLRPVLDHCVGPVLEVGAGCGAITRFLGEAGIETLALEGSPSRARIAAARCRGLTGVRLVVDTIQNFDPGPIFQTIILVGVLEYARVYSETASGTDPCDAMLAHLRSFLRPGGSLIVAIENQLGLKYFAGYPEDHLGERMAGIENRYGAKGPVTFGRRELRGKLSRSGLPHQRWWFPFPDYKVPGFLLSERGLSDDVGTDFSALLSAASLADPQRPATPFFSLQQAWPSVARNQLAGELANSFLVVASDEELQDDQNVAFYFNNGDNRHPSFNKSLRFYMEDGDLKVARSSLSNGDAGFSGVTADWPDEAFHDGELWQERLVRIVNQSGWDIGDVVEWASVWWTFAIEKIGVTRIERTEMVPGTSIDAIPRNLIVLQGKKFFIDQEWSVPPPIELGYLLYRSLLDAFLNIEVWSLPISGRVYTIGEVILEVSYGLGIWLSADDLQRYHDLESQFQSRVVGKPPYGPRVAPYTMSIRLRPELNELTVLSERIGALQSTAGSLQSEVGSLQEASTTAAVREADLAFRERTLVDELANKDVAIRDLSEALNEVRREHDETRQNRAVLSTKLAETEAKLNQVLDTLSETRRELENVHREQDGTRQGKVVLAVNFADAKAEVNRLSEDRARLGAQVERMTLLLRGERDVSVTVHEQLRRAKQRAKQSDASLRRKDEQLERIARSWTWRMTRPFRDMRRAILRLGRFSLRKQTDEVVIRKSGLFDASFYHQPRAGMSERDAIQHFAKTGWSEGRDPNAFFSLSWYAATYPDVVASGINPLVHYVRHGSAEGRRPGPDFDPKWYLESYPDVAASGHEPLQHFLQHGRHEGRLPRAEPTDDEATLIRASGLFHAAYYLDMNPDVQAANIDPLEHFLTQGGFERRNPNPLFDTAWYLATYPDVEVQGLNALVHYVSFGAAEKRKPSARFDPSAYIRTHPDVAATGVDPLRHCLESGGAA